MLRVANDPHRPRRRSRPGASCHAARQSRERVFLDDGDYALYRDWLAESCRRFGVEV
jgi:hypothetical protein